VPVSTGAANPHGFPPWQIKGGLSGGTETTRSASIGSKLCGRSPRRNDGQRIGFYFGVWPLDSSNRVAPADGWLQPLAGRDTLVDRVT
jgi:hypothetical protein